MESDRMIELTLIDSISLQISGTLCIAQLSMTIIDFELEKRTSP